MNMELYDVWKISSTIIKIVLAFVTGKLFAHIIADKGIKRFDSLIVMAMLVPALLMILILEIYDLYFFEYFLICGLSLFAGVLIGRRSLKEEGFPIPLLFLLIVIGILFGLGYYGLALVGIFLGWKTFFKYGKKLEKM